MKPFPLTPAGMIFDLDGTLLDTPCIRSSSANDRVLLHVQRSGHIGSPRTVGSSNASSASESSGSLSSCDKRPPPGFLWRPASKSSGATSSATPLRIVLSDRPVARETADTPPHPIERASIAAHRRLPRSSSSGSIRRYFSRILWTSFSFATLSL